MSIPIDPTPAPAVQRTLGILNLIFGGLLFVCGPCYGGSVLALPALMSFTQQQQAKVQERVEAERSAEIAALAEQEAKAETEEQKASLRAERIARENRPVPNVNPNTFDPKMMGLDDPRVRLHYGADAITCVILNLLFIISGVGLLRGASWGRALGVGTAWLKIIRLLVLTSSAIFIIQPVMSARMAQALKAAGPGAAAINPALAASGTQTTNTVMALVLLVGCLVYPIVLLVLLRRPTATTRPPGA